MEGLDRLSFRIRIILSIMNSYLSVTSLSSPYEVKSMNWARGCTACALINAHSAASFFIAQRRIVLGKMGDD